MNVFDLLLRIGRIRGDLNVCGVCDVVCGLCMFCFSIFVVCFVCYVLDMEIDGFDVVSSLS